MPGPRFKTGETVPETGIYQVAHNQHRLPHEVVILQGETFPRCAKCADDVFFELIYAVPELYGSIKYRIYELPVLEGDAAAS